MVGWKLSIKILPGATSAAPTNTVKQRIIWSYNDKSRLIIRAKTMLETLYTVLCTLKNGSYVVAGPPLLSSGQSFWLQIQRSRVRFPALSDFLSSSGSGTGSTQPREVN